MALLHRFLFAVVVVLLLAGCPVWGWADEPVGNSPFDRLREEDRMSFSVRFEKELWPLFTRNGPDGCVGCHHGSQNRGELKFAGKADADFRMLLRKGFLLPKDPGGMLYVVSGKDTRRRMPPGKRTPWSPREVELLRRFVLDLEKKQQ
jgi:hypothetical protein